MGYFSDGTAGDLYEAEFCNRCAHEDSEKGCPVWLAHLLFSYQLCNEKEHPGKVVLDMLIPTADGPRFNEQCAMFIPRDRLRKVPRPGSHRAPDGTTCRQDGREPIKNDAGEKIGERCIGCGMPFALPGRAGRARAA